MGVPKKEARVKAFEKKAFGMFIHYGLYSQLGVGEWAHYIRKIPMAEYIKLKETFTAEEFDAYKIVKTAKMAGMKYITFTTRHHDGFSLYDTRGLSKHDVMHSPAKRDLVGELVKACKDEGIMPIFYHTTLDWYQKSYKEDFEAYLEYLRRSIEILCKNYGEIGGFWFDGNWDKPGADWKLDNLYGTIRKYQPNALIINNTGVNARGELGHPEIDSVTFEQGLPKPIDREGMKKYVAGEMCQTINTNWGFAKNDFMYKSPVKLIEDLCVCRRRGANNLLNVGPSGSGKIPKIQEAILEVIGKWLEIYGKPIYEGEPCDIVGIGKDFGLKTPDGKVYLFIHDLYINGNINVTVGLNGSGLRSFSGIHDKICDVKWIDNGEKLAFVQESDSGLLCFDATGYDYGENFVVRVAEVSCCS